MDERTTRLREIVGRAAELAGVARDAYLAQACAADPALEREARELLDAALVDDAFLRTAGVRGAAGAALRAPFEACAGDVIGEFTLIRVIGSGGMGVVWEAEQHAPRRRVALKLVHADRVMPGALARFEREAELLARLRHPGIAQVIASGVDACADRRRPWYALELVEQATPLATAARALPLRRRIELLVDVCDAIHHAHLRGVVHRDLKSANVLVDGAGRARVIDFGIARELDAAAGLTLSGELLGTLASMSPEQLRGDPALVDARTDVWALGVLGYELACGVPPFAAQGRALPALAAAIEHAAPRPPSELSKDVDRDLELVLLHALEKEPARRYASADALRADLANWLGGRPIVARPATTLYQLKMFARRHRAASTALAAVVIVSLAAAAISTQFGLQACAAERASSRRFDDLRGLARSVLFELHDSIERIPGATEARQKLAAKGLEYLDLLERDAADDALLLCEIGEGRLRLGEVLGAPSHASLGDRDGARRELERAIELERRIRALQPGYPTRLLGARAKLMLGNVERASGNLERAAALAQESADEAAAAIAAGDRTRETARLASGGLTQRAKVLQRMGRTDEALAALQAELPKLEALIAAEPDWREPRRDLFLALLDVAQLLQRRARAAEALPHVERAYDLAAARREQTPRDQQALRDLSIALERRGDVATALGKPAEALADLDQAVALARELVELDPRDASALDNLSILCERQGFARGEAKDFEGSLQAFRESLALCQRRLALAPQGYEERLAVAIESQFVAQGLVRLKRRDEAQVELARAVELLEDLHRTHADSLEVERQLGTVHARLADEAAEQRSFADAFRHYDAAAAHIEHAAGRDPKHASTRRMVLAIACNRGSAHRRAGELAEGAERAVQFQAAISTLERALAEHDALRAAGYLKAGDDSARDEARADLEACREALGAAQSSP